MLKIGELDKRIIIQSVSNIEKEPKSNKNQNTKNNLHVNTKIFAGAAAFAAIAIAGIYLTNGRLKTPKKTNIPLSSHANDNKINEPAKIISENAKKLKKQVFDRFIAFRDKYQNDSEFVQRIKTVTNNIKSTVKSDRRILEQDDFNAVMALLKYDQKGAHSPVDTEIKRLDILINNSKPLEDDTVLYFGLNNSKNLYSFNPFESVKDFKMNNLVKNDNYLIVSRVYDDYIAQLDPLNYKGHENCGYIVRLNVPKGERGIDCRRCSGVESDKGINALYILPRQAQYKIRSIDSDLKIIDADYII